MTRRTLLGATGAAGAGLLLAACGARAPASQPPLAAAPAPPPAAAPARVGAAPPPADARPVEIKDFAFAPATLTIPRGATVSWLNRDAEPHTVVANDGAFKSSALDTDDRFARRFDAAGTFPYHCSIHPHMTGTVVVQ